MSVYAAMWTLGLEEHHTELSLEKFILQGKMTFASMTVFHGLNGVFER